MNWSSDANWRCNTAAISSCIWMRWVALCVVDSGSKRSSEEPADEEEHLFEYYMHFLIGVVKRTAKDMSSRKHKFDQGAPHSWQRLLYACKDKVMSSCGSLYHFSSDLLASGNNSNKCSPWCCAQIHSGAHTSKSYGTFAATTTTALCRDSDDGIAL